MENKKLLRYLLKDLSELEEMFTEGGKNSFDELEMEFIQNRVAGAKKLVQMFLEHENAGSSESREVLNLRQKPEPDNINIAKTGIWVEEKTPEILSAGKVSDVKIQEEKPKIAISKSTKEIEAEEKTTVVVPENKIPETSIEGKFNISDNNDDSEIVKVPEVEILEQPFETVSKQAVKMRPVAVQQELKLEDEEPVDIHNKRLGDSFSKEKSVNDLMSDDISKLEHKLSNRPVSSLQSAIGINDRFQFIRELFEGSVDDFVKTVADLDSMDDIKDAVDYLQTNFKWKKNDTSLKFVNLIKRRFPNE